MSDSKVKADAKDAGSTGGMLAKDVKFLVACLQSTTAGAISIGTLLNFQGLGMKRASKADYFDPVRGFSRRTKSQLIVTPT